MMIVYSVYNIKGGVGKTATAVNLAYLASQEGFRTLVWDLDPQGAASFYFRVKAKTKGGSRKLLKGQIDVADRIWETNHHLLDLLPSDFSNRHMDIILEEARNPAKLLSRVLEPLADEYDCVFLDCPPSVSVLSEAIFGVSDALLVPIIPTVLSLRTLEQIVALRADGNYPHLKILPFFTMVDRRKNMHRQFIEDKPSKHHGVLSVQIPYASDVERMGVELMPLPCFAPRSPSALAYQGLWREIRKSVHPGGRRGG